MQRDIYVAETALDSQWGDMNLSHVTSIIPRGVLKTSLAYDKPHDSGDVCEILAQLDTIGKWA